MCVATVVVLAFASTCFRQEWQQQFFTLLPNGLLVCLDRKGGKLMGEVRIVPTAVACDVW
jgi:hypothetical protein